MRRALPAMACRARAVSPAEMAKKSPAGLPQPRLAGPWMLPPRTITGEEKSWSEVELFA